MGRTRVRETSDVLTNHRGTSVVRLVSSGPYGLPVSVSGFPNFQTYFVVYPRLPVSFGEIPSSLLDLRVARALNRVQCVDHPPSRPYVFVHQDEVERSSQS